MENNNDKMLPPPPIPPDVDLRSFDDMPLGVQALRDSETAQLISDAGFRAAVFLWCAAWHQIPSSSLPDDDRQMAYLAGYGRDIRGWKKVKIEALRGFEKCSDGRLYHQVIAKKALKAWEVKRSRVRGAEITNDKTGLKQVTGKQQNRLPLTDPHSDTPSERSSQRSAGRSTPRPATATELKGYNPPIPPLSENADGSGYAYATPARPSAAKFPVFTTEHGAQDAEGRICVHYPDVAEPGKRPERYLWINPQGIIDSTTNIPNPEPLEFTDGEPLLLRRKAIQHREKIQQKQALPKGRSARNPTETGISDTS